MPDQPHQDRDTATPLVLVAVLLVIIATGLIILQHSGQYPSGGREAVNLAFSSGGLKQLEQSWLAPDRSAGLLRPSPPNR